MVTEQMKCMILKKKTQRCYKLHKRFYSNTHWLLICGNIFSFIGQGKWSDNVKVVANLFILYNYGIIIQ